MRNRLTHADGMGNHDVALERGKVVGLNANARELAKTGIDSVDGLVLGNDGLHRFGAGFDGGPDIPTEPADLIIS